MSIYRVKNWEIHFENSESKKYKSLKWVRVSNKHDGSTYRRVVSHPKSVSVFCAWSLIIQVASKMPTRGLLRDGDGAITTSDLSFKTGFPEQIFKDAFEVLTRPEIGWIEIVQPGELLEILGPSDDLGKSPQIPGEIPVEQNKIEGIKKGCVPRAPEAPSSEEWERAWSLARIALHWLNERGGFRYGECEAHMNLIAHALFTAGGDIEGVKTMISRQVKAWKGTKHQDHLTPQTLFAADKFPKYYGQRDAAIVAYTPERDGKKTKNDNPWQQEPPKLKVVQG